METSRVNSRYLVVIEPAGPNYSVYAPDVPGCVATGDTFDEALEHMKEALSAHVNGLEQGGERAPEPAAAVDYVEVTIERSDSAPAETQDP